MDATAVEVRANRPVGEGMVALGIEAPPGFDARPGQFVLVRATVDGEAIARHYTVSSPAVGETFEVTVEAEGTLGRHLAGLDPGDGIRIEGPFGRVYYEGDEPVVAVAGGPGVGAAVAVAERAVAGGRGAAVVYRDDRIAHEDRLAALAAGGASVYVVRERLAEAIDAAGSGAVYAFGFRPFLEDVRGALAAAGRDPDAAAYENFGPGPDR